MNEQCARAGCRAAAAWSVVWRNPRIHAEDRSKVWLACDEHRDFLHDYLTSRGFPAVVEVGIATPRGGPS